ncbi:MAG: hypothetical protein R3C54_07455 [Parvularculaceae bacterium]
MAGRARKQTIKINQTAGPFFIRRGMYGELRASPISGPFGAPAQRKCEIDLSEPDLAALGLTLWLAWPGVDEAKKRALAARKIISHWLANGRPSPRTPLSAGLDFDRRTRLRAIATVTWAAKARITAAVAYVRRLEFAAMAEASGGRVKFLGPSSVKAISAARASAAGKVSGSRERSDGWAKAKPVLHLALAVDDAGGMGALFAAGCDGDAAVLRSILDTAERRRRTLPMFGGVEIEKMVQFRPAPPAV